MVYVYSFGSKDGDEVTVLRHSVVYAWFSTWLDGGREAHRKSSEREVGSMMISIS